jgi:phosphomethylpyrimidine synthase
VGTMPLYQVCEELDDILDMTPQHFLDAVEHQAKQGVDYLIAKQRSMGYTDFHVPI